MENYVRGWPSLCDLRCVVLLGGDAHRNRFVDATGRSLLELPIENGVSLLHHWKQNLGEVAELAGIQRLQVRVMIDALSPRPQLPTNAEGRVSLRVERDPQPARGTGGLLRDVTRGYDDGDLILVLKADQILFEPLADLVSAMAGTGGDICVVSHPDGSPSGVMLLRCACLSVIPEVGPFDMREQALPLISQRFRGSAVYRKMPLALPVRRPTDYIRALSSYHRLRLGMPDGGDPRADDWRPSFSIVEDGARVDPDVRLHDSVVLGGGRVESEACVVRSIVCPRGRVDRSRTVVDKVVSH